MRIAIREYQVLLFRDCKLSPGTIEGRTAALRFLFVKTLRRPYLPDHIPFPGSWLPAHRRLGVFRPECRSNPSNSCRRCHSLHSNYMLNRGYAYTTIISSKYHGQTLLSHLASLYPHSTPQAWQQKLNNGDVTLNGVTATGSESVTLGQTLVWNRPPWIEPVSPQHFEVLFEDPHLLAVNKPSGLPTLPRSEEHTSELQSLRHLVCRLLLEK